MVTWAIAALLVGLVLIVLEVFIPSGGILGFLAAGMLVVCLILAFIGGLTTGLIFTLVLCVAVPGALALAMHYWPRTPMGKRLFLSPATADEINPAGPKQQALPPRGSIGRTLTPLRPSGVTEFEGRRVDTIAEGVMIEQGQQVRVMAVQGNRVVVRKVEPGEHAEHAEPVQEPSFDLPSA